MTTADTGAPDAYHYAVTLPAWYGGLPSEERRALTLWLKQFHPFQRRWLLEPARQAIANKSRQIGYSHTTAAVGDLWGAFHGELTTIISIGEREALEVLDKAVKHAAVLCGLGSKMARVIKSPAGEVHFASGGRILALPSSGGRSFTGNVFLDEYAYQQHAGEVWDAAAAVTMLGDFRLRVASTPNGVGNEFHRLWSDPRASKGWAKHEVTIDQAIAEGYPVNLDECWKMAKGDPRLFDQLFRCKFLDGEAQYIPSEAVTACSSDDLYTFEGEYFAGLDIGRTADRTELVIIRKLPDGSKVVQWLESCKRTSTEDLERLAMLAVQGFGVRRLCVDATGMGAFPAERMQRAYPHRVEAVQFTAAVKEDLAGELHAAFTSGALRIPLTDAGLSGVAAQLRAPVPLGAADRLRHDVQAVRRIITTAGNVRYDAPHTDDGHADSAWALALALHACAGPDRRRHVYGDPVPAQKFR